MNLKENLIKKAIKLMEEGFHDDVITNELTENDGVSEQEAADILRDAYELVENEFDHNLKQVIALHVSRYRKQINRLLAVEELDPKQIGKSITAAQFQASRKKKIKSYLQALDVMSQLESVLQLTSNESKISINEEINVEINETPASEKYDISKLSLPEKVRMLELLSKAREDHQEIQSITEGKMEHVSLVPVTTIDENKNIDSITQIQPEAPHQQVPFNAFDPVAKLKSLMKRISAKELDAIGANLDEIERKYLNS